MHYDPDRHHRRSIRLKHYDYSQGGAYFLTLCVHNRECLLSDIVNDTAILSEVGQTVKRVWHTMPERFPGLVLDSIVIMPNHVHAIVFLPGRFTYTPDKMEQGAASSANIIEEGAASSAPTVVTLGSIMRAFKSLSAREANRLLERVEQPFWQRNYYERIIRDQRELELTRTYIDNNPLQWQMDAENPDAKPIP